MELPFLWINNKLYGILCRLKSKNLSCLLGNRAAPNKVYSWIFFIFGAAFLEHRKKLNFEVNIWQHHIHHFATETSVLEHWNGCYFYKKQITYLDKLYFIGKIRLTILVIYQYGGFFDETAVNPMKVHLMKIRGLLTLCIQKAYSPIMRWRLELRMLFCFIQKLVGIIRYSRAKSIELNWFDQFTVRLHFNRNATGLFFFITLKHSVWVGS